MGCLNEKQDHYNTFAYEFEEEKRISEWEKKNDYMLKYRFTDILSNLIFVDHLLKISSFNSFVVQKYNKNVLHYIKHPYFLIQSTNESYYDSFKIKLFFLVTTKAVEINDESNSYYDKASYIYALVKSNPESNLTEALFINEQKLLMVLRECIEIALVVTTDVYNEYENKENKGYLKTLRTVKDNVLSEVIQYMFRKTPNRFIYKEKEPEQHLDHLSFYEFNSIFERNCLVKYLF